MALTAKKVYAILKRQISDMEAKIKTPIIYRGTVATADLLPLNPDIGDMYNIESKSVYGEAGMNVAWNGVVWDTMGAPIDMSLYIKSSELADWVKQQNKPTYTAEEVGALPADTKIPSKTSDLQNDSGFLTKIPDNYLSGTDKTLSVSGKAADAKAVGDKNVELLADISNKLNKNQGSENSGKIAGINESGDIVPMFPVSVDYNEETNCLEFGSDQKMELNQGIGLDSTLTKTGYAADAGVVGEITNLLKEDLYDVSKNLINNKAMVDGYYTTTTTEPTIKENTGLKCILVKIKGNTVYTLSSVSYSSVFYDANKQKISALDKSNSALTFTSPSNSKYISISAYNEYAKTVMLVEGNTLPVEFENYKYENAMTIAKKALELTESIDYKVYHVGVGQEYTNFTNLIKKLDGDATKKIIYIHPGIYDIFAEYGGSSFAKTIADTDWRKWSAVVPPNTRVIGLGRVVFNFLPSSDECTKNSISVLSPINTSGSCIIENITINCKNCRYGIHDETSGLSEFYFAEKMFKNVRVYRTANDTGLSSPYGHAYASGFDVGVNVSFENCIFESPSLAWSVHDRVVKGIINNGGIFNLKHSIFKGDSYAGLQFLNNNTDPSETIVNIIDCDVNKLRVEKVSKSSAQKNGYNITSRLCKNIPVITDFDDVNDYPYKALNVIS